MLGWKGESGNWFQNSGKGPLEHDGHLGPGSGAGGIQPVSALAGEDALIHGPAHGVGGPGGHGVTVGIAAQIPTPAWRASTVISMPRVVEAAGEKAVEEVPVIRPLSTA